LKQALSKLEKLKERSRKLAITGSRMFNPGWHLCRDLSSMLTVAEAVTRSALARRESRGAHSRIDHPKLDSIWGETEQHNFAPWRSNGTPASSDSDNAGGITNLA
jgi:succinate dehydrogenase / fumarate reductase, flavoprotein subunit